MSQRSSAPLKRDLVRRTLSRFWWVTKKKPFATFMAVFTSVAYTALLTYANTWMMGKIVDRVQAEPVSADRVFEVFGPYILALLVINAVGQACSKLQDWSVMELELNGNYHLARLCFDTLSNQSMTFHTSRFGGALVSQTSRFMSGYTGLVDVVVYSLIPTIASIFCTIITLAPVAPLFVAILFALLTLYVVVAYTMYEKILPLSAATAAAQNRLSGVLSDAVTNILAVKTYGREDYERGLFDAADKDAMAAEKRSMNAMMARGAMTSTLITIIMLVTSIFVTGGNAWYGISAGTLVMMFSYTYQLSMRFNYINSMMQRMNRAVGDASEMTRILDEPRLVEDVPGAQPLVVRDGAIDFEGLAFRYLDAAEGDYVFEGLDLHVPAGQPAPRPRGTLGVGQDHAHQAAPAPRRRAGGPCARGWSGHLPVHPAVPAPADRLRAAGGAAVPPLHPREHRVRAPRRDRRRDSRGGASGQRAGVRRPAAQRHGHHGRRARRQALGRPAPARGDRPRDTGGLPDPRAR